MTVINLGESQFYRIADVGRSHGLRVIVNVFKLAVHQVVVESLRADAVVHVVQLQDLSRGFGHEAHCSVRRHPSLTDGQGRSFAAILWKGNKWL